MSEMKWQPIETAPRDRKTYILATDGHKVYQARRDTYKNSSLYRYKSSGGAYIVATHWMPLPPPPEDV